MDWIETSCCRRRGAECNAVASFDLAAEAVRLVRILLATGVVLVVAGAGIGIVLL